MGDAFEVVVVGGGAIGAASALELTRRRMRVAVIERERGWAQGCSYANAGWVCPALSTPFATVAEMRQALQWLARHDTPLGVRIRPGLLPWLARLLRASTPGRVARTTSILSSLALESWRLHHELKASGIDSGLCQSGLLDVYTNPRTTASIEAVANRRRHDGITAELLEPREAYRRLPWLAAKVAGAVWYPGEAYCDPRLFGPALGNAAVAAGAKLFADEEVKTIADHRDKVAIWTTRRQVHADAVVLAAGTWTAGLARSIGARLPIEAGKGYVIDLKMSDVPKPAVPAYLHDHRVAITPLDDRLRAAGTLQFEGMNVSIDGRRTRRIEEQVREAVRGVSARDPLSISLGLHPCTPDGLPLVGPIDRRRRILVAAGHAMLGITLAPITGHLVADWIEARAIAEEARALVPARFSYAMVPFRRRRG